MIIHDLGAILAPPATSRPLHPTMGQGVAERTYLRRVFTDLQAEKLGGYGILLNPTDPNFQKWYVAALNSGFYVDQSDSHPLSAAPPDTRWETWAELAHRVALGSVSLLADLPGGHFEATAISEHQAMSSAIANGELLMSGRHLQQGDGQQRTRNLEVFSNCATAATTFALFKLLLNGSGVGRDYSDQMMVVDWAQDMPTVVAVLDDTHPDYRWGYHMTPREALHLYGEGQGVVWFTVPDSREGWGQGVERLEVATFLNGQRGKSERVKVLVLNFSEVRGEGQPIMGMQGRPSSGPSPLMDAIGKIAKIKGTGMAPWRATLYIDHYCAEPVLVGGARRSARMSTKWWQDDNILDFIMVKRPIEFEGLSPDEVAEKIKDLAAQGETKPLSFLWSSNNSVAVDADFWHRVNGPVTSDPLTIKAKQVFDTVMACSYGDGTGEPGFINVDRLAGTLEGTDTEAYASGQYVGSKKFTPSDDTHLLLQAIYDAFVDMPFHYITNPCGEISLLILGGFCVIADIVPFYSDSPERAIEVARLAVRALIRVNTMDSIYGPEVKRTNRIGVGVTGIHEAAWKFFRVAFRDLVNPDFEGYDAAGFNADSPAPIRAAAFWDWMGRLGMAIRSESERYAAELGMNTPHTCTTVKPSGSVSKLFGLSEGWHLPALRYYIRWVQLHKNSPKITEYREQGYPVRELKTYRDHWIVGFPTEPAICATDIGDLLVTAGEATVDEQFRWLNFGEFFLLEGGSVEDWIINAGDLDLLTEQNLTAWGNQISYTLKYRPEDTPFTAFREMMAKHLPYVRCCSVMPQSEGASYEYLPEEAVSVLEYQGILAEINRDEAKSEDVGLEHLSCDGGACPVVFKTVAKEDL